MKRVWNFINSRPLNPVILILFFTIIGGIIFYLFRESEDAFDYFFTCFGTGISIAVFQCAYIQNQIQKDNIKIQLFDKRYSVYRSVMDTITIIKRDNWDRCILFDNIDTNRQILQIEENLFKSVHLSACLFDADLYTKLIDINNAFCKVAEAYKKMLINNLKSLKNGAFKDIVGPAVSAKGLQIEQPLMMKMYGSTDLESIAQTLNHARSRS